MITFKEYLNEIAIKGKAVKQEKKKVTLPELIELVNNRDAEGLENADVSEISDMEKLFANTDIGYGKFNPDISKWDTSNVTDMSFMFRNCSSFNQDLSSWNVSKVTDMTYMFDNCVSFNQDISKWDVSNVKLARFVFNRCQIEQAYKPKFKD